MPSTLNNLKHFQKNCSHAVGESKRAVFWSFGFVSAQLQDFSNLLLCQRPMIGSTRQNSKILAPARLQFFFKRPKALMDKLNIRLNDIFPDDFHSRSCRFQPVHS